MLFVGRCPLLVGRSLSFVGCCSLTVRCSLLVVRCLWFVACRLLIVCWLSWLFVLPCSLGVVRCLSFVVVFFLLLFVRCLLLAVWCVGVRCLCLFVLLLLFVGCSFSIVYVDCRVMLSVCCSLLVVRCLWFVV